MLVTLFRELLFVAAFRLRHDHIRHTSEVCACMGLCAAAAQAMDAFVGNTKR